MTMQERRKLVSELKQQGKSNTEIARILCITRKQVEYALETKDYRPKTKICEECGEEFIPKRSKRKICYKEECYIKRHRRQVREYQQRQAKSPYGRIRPYTYTSNLLIADDIKKGRSIKWMARMYDRDPDDLKKHIDKIKNDGTLEKILRRIYK
ncbi:MAG: hypothetical protein GX918_04985 [Clostridiales bacterium]|jgi:hypothetical protein|nr:hypothetical protein [Oligella ureolytica]NLZ91253.1 hypothetical protein [Clostridiales bacterium]